jgi:hypothetical protein
VRYFFSLVISIGLLMAVSMLFCIVGCGGDVWIFEEKPSVADIDEIVKKIEEVNIVMGRAVGAGGDRPEQYDNFIYLKNNATKDELIGLTDHTNPTVRCYAFWALSYNPTADLLPIIYKHRNDNEIVMTLSGCIGMDEKVIDFFVRVYERRSLPDTVL